MNEETATTNYELDAMVGQIEQSKLIEDLLEGWREIALDINWGKGLSITDKAQAFIESPLFALKKQFESPAYDLTSEDTERISELNAFFEDKNNDLKFQSVVQVLLEVQRRMLEKIEVDPAKIESEIFHIKQVIRLAQAIFSENKVLVLIAAVHDSVKYLNANTMGLALHELLSSHFGPSLLSEVLTAVFPGKTSAEQMSALQKLASRAIFLHGHGEFPYNMSANSPLDKNTGLYCLPVGNTQTIYPRPALDPTHLSRPDLSHIDNGDYLQKTLETALETVPAMNVVDILTGCLPASFGKYNLFYESTVIAGYDNISEYIDKNIFAGFESNLSSSSVQYLLGKEDPELIAIVARIRLMGQVFKNLFTDENKESEVDVSDLGIEGDVRDALQAAVASCTDYFNELRIALESNSQDEVLLSARTNFNKSFQEIVDIFQNNWQIFLDQKVGAMAAS